MATDNTLGTARSLEERWLFDIKRGTEARKKLGCEERWDDIDDYYENRNNITKDAVKPYFNLIYMHGRALMPSLVYRAPHIVNVARRPEKAPFAAFMDSIDNLLVEEMEVYNIYKEAALHAFLYNTVAVQTCYDFPDTKTAELEEAVRNISSFPRVTHTTNRARRVNLPWLDLIHPKKLILPAGAKNARTLPWFAKMLCVPLEALKKMKGLQNVEATHIPEDLPAKKALMEYFGLEDGEYDEYCVFYEIHDARDQKWAWLNTNGKFMFGPEPDPTQVDGLPVDLITFNPSSRSLWGTPDALYIESQMLEGNECRVMGAKQRRVSLLKLLINEDMLSKEELEKFYSDDAAPALRIKNLGTKTLQESIAILQPHINQEMFTYQKEILNDSKLLLGFGPNQLGTVSTSRTTKYETQVVEDSNAARTNERREILGNSIKTVFQRVNQLIIKNWSFPVVQRVLGVDGAMYWVKGQPSDLADLTMELSTSVNVESMAPVSTERIKGELMQLLQAIGGTGVNILPIVQQLLAKMPYLDATGIMPQAVQSGGPMDIKQFAQQQQQMAGDPATQDKLKANLSPGLRSSKPKPSASKGKR